MNTHAVAALLTATVMLILRVVFPPIPATSEAVSRIGRDKLRLEIWVLTGAFFVPILLAIPAVRYGLLPDDQLFSIGVTFSLMVALPAALMVIGRLLRGRGWVGAIVAQLAHDSQMGPGAGRVFVGVLVALGTYAAAVAWPALLEWRASSGTVVG